MKPEIEDDELTTLSPTDTIETSAEDLSEETSQEDSIQPYQEGLPYRPQGL